MSENLRPALPPAEKVDNVLPFRPSKDRPVKRLKMPLWRRLLKPLALAIVIVAAPAFLIVWILQSPRFALQDIQWSARNENRRVEQDAIIKGLERFAGQNLWLLSLADVEKQLDQQPWIASISLRKVPPRTLVVEIVEKHEIALYRYGYDLYYLDASGKRIERFDPTKAPRGSAADLPILSGGDPAVHLEAAVDLLRELEKNQPSWYASLSEIEILSEQDFRLFTSEVPFPLLVRAGTLNDKAHRLEALLPQIVERYQAIAAVDLRFARRIIVQPIGPERAPVKVSLPTGFHSGTTQHA
jgi:cell division protein FtsQ